MLVNLSISNFALIDELGLGIGAGFSTITGETGAGKSILLGALGLLLGNRSDSKSLGDKSKKCVIEAEFEVSKLGLESFFDTHELDFESNSIIRRELTPSGKSRAFVNDTPVRLEVLKELGEYLIDIHSQHQTLLLKKNNFQLNILDSFSDNFELLKEYKGVFNKYQKLKRSVQALEESRAKESKDFDYNSFLLSELLEAKIVEGELEDIESNLKVAENASEIKQLLAESYIAIEEQDGSSISQLSEIAVRLEPFSDVLSEVGQLNTRLRSTIIELQDIAQELYRTSESIESDQETLIKLQERNDVLINLSQKHQARSTTELLELQNELEQKIQVSISGDEELKKLNAELDEVEKSLVHISNRLHEKRVSKKTSLENEVAILLKNLGMPDAVLKITVEKTEITSSGTDKIDFKFSANKGREPELLGKVASGGEFSRLMFVLKYLQTDKTQLPTVIFDEIDTGISGEIALKMAEMMSEMAKGHQIITITHLPQVAGFGSNHFYVFKDRSGEVTNSQIRQLERSERVQKIAEMISGENPTESALKSAAELLKG